MTQASGTAALADRISAAVADCPLVARLADGPIATYLPDHVVRGVAVRDDHVRIAVVAAYGPPLAEVVRQVRAAARRWAPERRIDVEVLDIEPVEPA
jgi:hypothetical protein